MSLALMLRDTRVDAAAIVAAQGADTSLECRASSLPTQKQLDLIITNYLLGSQRLATHITPARAHMATDKAGSPEMAAIRERVRGRLFAAGSREMRPAITPFPGTKRFRVVRQLGVGGMGAVYEVYDRAWDRRVALKTLLHPDAGNVHQFKSEFRALQGIEHPNLLRLYELIQDNGRWFFTMEIIRGSDIRSYIRRTWPDVHDTISASIDSSADTEQLDTMNDLCNNRHAIERLHTINARYPDFDDRRLRSCLRQLAMGLHTLHTAGKIHRDVKPSNIMVTAEGNVTIVDFGLILDLAQHDPIGDSHIVGTPAFMSPEQAAGVPVTEATDWYGVGVLLYEILSGRLPFQGPPGLIMSAKQRNEPPPPRAYRPDIPADLNALCHDLLRLDPNARPKGEQILARLGVGADVATNIAPLWHHRVSSSGGTQTWLPQP